MLKVIGFGLLGLFVVMIFPSTITDGANPMFYGTASMVLADSDGNVLLTNTVHNRITDEGETFIIDQVFDTAATAQTGNARVGAVCISGAIDSAFAETTVASLATGLTNPSGNHCKSTAVVGTGTSTAITDAEVFTAGTDFGAGETISGILICLKGDQGDADFAECNTPTPAVALAALDFVNATVSGTDTITITYTFDIVTAGS